MTQGHSVAPAFTFEMLQAAMAEACHCKLSTVCYPQSPDPNFSGTVVQCT